MHVVHTSNAPANTAPYVTAWYASMPLAAPWRLRSLHMSAVCVSRAHLQRRAAFPVYSVCLLADTALCVVAHCAWAPC